MRNHMQATAQARGDPNSQRTVAVTVGVLFIFATVSAIAGVLLYGPILGPDYLVRGAENGNQVILGAIMELVLVVSAIGTAIGLFPILRRYGERIALAHLAFRFLEAVIITVGIVSVLALLTLSKEFAAAAAPDVSAFQASGSLLLAVHDWTFLLGPSLMLGANTLAYSYLLYRSRLVPRPLAALGLAGATLILISGFVQMFGVFQPLTTPVILLALPIAAYEMILAVWLIAKGFNWSAAASEPARTATSERLSEAA